MPFDISLRDNGSETFDVSLQPLAGTEKTVTFLGMMAPSTIDTGETSCLFVE